MIDYADLINQLLKRHKRMQSRGTFIADPTTADLIKQAADAIEALVQERDERIALHLEQLQIARQDSYSYGLRDGERIRLEMTYKNVEKVAKAMFGGGWNTAGKMARDNFIVLAEER